MTAARQSQPEGVFTLHTPVRRQASSDISSVSPQGNTQVSSSVGNLVDAANTIIPRLDRVVLSSPRKSNQTLRREDVLLMAKFLDSGYLGLERPPSAPYLCPFRKQPRIDLVTDIALIALYGPSKYTNWSIMVVDRFKEWPDAYHETIQCLSLALKKLVELFPIFGPFHVSLAEIALDALDEKLARRVMKTIHHPWTKADKTFNYSEGCRDDGPSPTGFEQYLYHRWAGRQFHDYEKADDFFRFEMILSRPYLRRQAIHSVEDLFNKAPDLLAKNVKFIKLNRQKLLKEFPQARGWGLHKMQPIAQVAEIQRHLERLTGKDYTAQDIRGKYYQNAPAPNILLSMFDPENRTFRERMDTSDLYSQRLTNRQNKNNKTRT